MDVHAPYLSWDLSLQLLLNQSISQSSSSLKSAYISEPLDLVNK